MSTSSKEQRILDKNSEYFGVSMDLLSENAGEAVAEATLQHPKVRPPAGKKAVVFAGTGNNGADALIAARLLSEWVRTKIYILAPEPHDFSPLYQKALDTVKGLCVFVTSPADFPKKKPDIIVDGIFGTGFRGRPEGVSAQAIKWINSARSFVVSVDLPSGLNADTGEFSLAVRANLTVTFHDEKPSFRTGKVKKLLGKLVVADIGIHSKASTHVGPGDLEQAIKPRTGSEHKGDFGRVLVIGGSSLYTGAPILAALGVLRAGADLSYAATPQAFCGFPDIIKLSLDSEYLIPEHIPILKPLLDKADAILMGPGLGEDKQTKQAVNELLSLAGKKPIILDADAIKAVKADSLKKLNVLLTPHAKEFSKLAGRKVPKDFDARLRLVNDFAKRYKVTVLLKGPVDIISDGSRVKLNDTGNARMTVGGTGDVLSGLAAGFVVQSDDLFYSACAAAFVNGSAGDRLKKKKGNSYIASELLDAVPNVLKKYA